MTPKLGRIARILEVLSEAPHTLQELLEMPDPPLVIEDLVSNLDSLIEDGLVELGDEAVYSLTALGHKTVRRGDV